MSWSDGPARRRPSRRFLLAGLAGGALSACGFRPMLAEGGVADGLQGAVVLAEAVDPESFAYRERLRRRFGDAGAGARYRLDYRLILEEQGVAIAPDSDVTRFQIAASAEWRLTPLTGDRKPVEGRVRAAGAYDAASEPFATLSAQRSEREQLATELAERTATRVVVALSAAGA